MFLRTNWSASYAVQYNTALGNVTNIILLSRIPFDSSVPARLHV